MGVSKNGLPLIGFGAVEGETRGKRSPKFPQSLDRFFPAAIAANLELPGIGRTAYRPSRHAPALQGVEMIGVFARSLTSGLNRVSGSRFL
jgi:hypothetical protein